MMLGSGEGWTMQKLWGHSLGLGGENWAAVGAGRVWSSARF